MASILQRIASKDPSAVRDCVDEYGGMVWRLAKRYLNRVPGDVDDAVQEVFFEIWASAARFDPKLGTERGFVATIAHRRLIDYQRHLTSRRADMPTLRTDRQDPGAPASLAEALGEHDLSELAKEFDNLPDTEREALWLSIHSGMSHRQIAEAIEVPIGTVKSRLRRGLLRLYEALRPRGRGAQISERTR